MGHCSLLRASTEAEADGKVAATTIGDLYKTDRSTDGRFSLEGFSMADAADGDIRVASASVVPAASHSAPNGIELMSGDNAILSLSYRTENKVTIDNPVRSITCLPSSPSSSRYSSSLPRHVDRV